MLSTRSTDEALWEHIASDRAHAGRLVSEGHLRAEMGGGTGLAKKGNGGSKRMEVGTL